MECDGRVPGVASLGRARCSPFLQHLHTCQTRLLCGRVHQPASHNQLDEYSAQQMTKFILPKDIVRISIIIKSTMKIACNNHLHIQGGSKWMGKFRTADTLFLDVAKLKLRHFEEYLWPCLSSKVISTSILIDMMSFQNQNTLWRSNNKFREPEN